MEHQPCCLVNIVEVLCYWAGSVGTEACVGKFACCMRKPKLHYPRRPLAGKYDLGRTRRQWRRNIKAVVFGFVSTEMKTDSFWACICWSLLVCFCGAYYFCGFVDQHQSTFPHCGLTSVHIRHAAVVLHWRPPPPRVVVFNIEELFPRA